MHHPRYPERFIRFVWQHQLFASSSLCTSGGSRVVVDSPGAVNTDGGPDFRNARVRIGPVTYRGDIELHITESSWRNHHHADDPHYNGVILHVVLTAGTHADVARTSSGRVLPVLVLEQFLDPQIFDYWRREDRRGVFRPPAVLPCHGADHPAGRETVEGWLRVLARERLELRMRSLQARLHELIDARRNFLCEPILGFQGNADGIPPPFSEYSRTDYAAEGLWEHLLYESIVEGLGYVKNMRPFAALARALPLEKLRHFDLHDHETMQALLFGAAGLLPSARALPEKESRIYVRMLRCRWREVRGSLSIPILHAADWLFFRLRPYNFPTARIAALSFLLPSLFAPGAFRRMIQLLRSDPPATSTALAGARALFRFMPNHYWSCHLHFGAAAGNQGVALGQARVDELLTNTVIPLALLYARIFVDHAVRRNAMSLLWSLPPPPPNAITRIVMGSFLGGKLRLRTVPEHQGALHLHARYCTAGRCAECAIGKAKERGGESGKTINGARGRR